MRSIVTFLCFLLAACSTCPKFVDYERSTVDVEGIKAAIPTGTPLPVEFNVAKVKIDPHQREASEQIQKMDLAQYSICSQIKELPDGPAKDQLRTAYIQKVMDILEKTAEASAAETSAGFDVELQSPKFFKVASRNIIKAELKWRFKPLETRNDKAAHVLAGLTSVHDESLVEGGSKRTSQTCKEVASCIVAHAWNLADNPAVIRGGSSPTELTWTAEISDKVKVIRVWWEFYQQEADKGNICTVDQSKPYPSDGIPFLKLANKELKDVAGSCYRIWNYSTFNVGP